MEAWVAEPTAPVRRRPSLPPAHPRTPGGVQGTCRRGRAEPGHQATLQERHLEGEAAASRAEREAHKPGLRTPGAQPTHPGRRSPPRRLARCQHPARSVLQKGGSFLVTQGPWLRLPPLLHAWGVVSLANCVLYQGPLSSPEIHVVAAQPF